VLVDVGVGVGDGVGVGVGVGVGNDCGTHPADINMTVVGGTRRR
jgi:hypothetical protein